MLQYVSILSCLGTWGDGCNWEGVKRELAWPPMGCAAIFCWCNFVHAEKALGADWLVPCSWHTYISPAPEFTCHSAGMWSWCSCTGACVPCSTTHNVHLFKHPLSELCWRWDQPAPYFNLPHQDCSINYVPKLCTAFLLITEQNQVTSTFWVLHKLHPFCQHLFFLSVPLIP